MRKIETEKELKKVVGEIVEGLNSLDKGNLPRLEDFICAKLEGEKPELAEGNVNITLHRVEKPSEVKVGVETASSKEGYHGGGESWKIIGKYEIERKEKEENQYRVIYSSIAKAIELPIAVEQDDDFYGTVSIDVYLTNNQYEEYEKEYNKFIEEEQQRQEEKNRNKVIRDLKPLLGKYPLPLKVEIEDYANGCNYDTDYIFFKDGKQVFHIDIGQDCRWIATGASSSPNTLYYRPFYYAKEV